MISRIKFVIYFLIIFEPLYALELPKEVLQGSLVIGQEKNINQLMIDGIETKLSHYGYYVFGVGRDHEEPINVTFILNNEVTNIHKINIIKQDYEIQSIDGLPEQMVTPLEDEIIQRIIAENKIIKERKLIDLDLTYFIEEFAMPTQGIISGVFGSQRILNGKPKSPHRGLDIAAKEGAAVVAANDGVVILAEEDLYYTGGTIMLDHGHGVKSIYAHMSKVSVKLDDQVRRNDIIGAVGSTGRSTGPHLHWGVMVFKIYVDPRLLIE